MTDHPLTEEAVAERWNTDARLNHWNYWSSTSRAAILSAFRAAFDAGREHERANPADPHHDPRPWQDCAREDIRKGDLMGALSFDILFVGVAHYQDERGDWFTAEHERLTDDANWDYRRIPAPTPPAEEVELPSEPCVLTDVQLRKGVALWPGPEAVATTGFTGRAVTIPAQDLAAFTLPDGTRARRHGNYDDGTPRFVQAQEEEK